MIHSELYLKPTDIEAGVEAIKRVQATQKKVTIGLAPLLGIIAAKLGNDWDCEYLVNSFYGQMLRERRAAEKLISFAKAMVARNHVHGSHLNYNDLDDNLWAHVKDGETIVELPHCKHDLTEERKPNGMRDVHLFWTRYTIYHESHGHGYIFFVQENTYTDEKGERTVFNTELHIRRFDEIKNNFKKTAPKKLWEKYIKYEDQRDHGFVVSAKFHDQDGKTHTSCIADLWCKNVFGELEHFDYLISTPDEEI